MIPKSDELITYLSEALEAIKRLINVASSRNKTTKIKALVSMLKIVEARVDGSLRYIKAGGHTEFTVALQQQMYNPILEWIGDEISK